jgi:hypothetical protein
MTILYIYRCDFLLQIHNAMPHASATSLLVQFPANVKDILFLEVSGPALGPAQPPVCYIQSDKGKGKIHPITVHEWTSLVV